MHSRRESTQERTFTIPPLITPDNATTCNTSLAGDVETGDWEAQEEDPAVAFMQAVRPKRSDPDTFALATEFVQLSRHMAPIWKSVTKSVRTVGSECRV
jgi:hypothetical protein